MSNTITETSTCVECQVEADKSKVAVDWWCWMFGCSLSCDCYGREVTS